LYLQEILKYPVEIKTMETQDFNKGINVSVYKLSAAKQLEENARRLLEHYQKVQEQRNKKKEVQKQEFTSFICDWQ
jgi:ABC-type hemin transport system substrate-binding protein